jgi:hypothetical protein
MVEELILSGADIVKIGIGPGSVCTTRYIYKNEYICMYLYIYIDYLDVYVDIYVYLNTYLNIFIYTRKQTGVGYPQLSAVLECADSAHGLGIYIMYKHIYIYTCMCVCLHICIYIHTYTYKYTHISNKCAHTNTCIY